MKQLKRTDIIPLISGSLFYGTGGGGSPKRAKQILLEISKKNPLPSIIKTAYLNTNGICITGFPIGNLQSDVIDNRLFQTMLNKYQAFLDQIIQAIVPVEIGPLSLAVSVQLASTLQLPLVDADIVGGRSSPEVFLETITLFSIPRTPLLVFNAQGAYKMLTNKSTYQKEEFFLRSFAKKSGGFAYVFGYPLTKKAILRSVSQNTVSRAIIVGNMITRKVLLKRSTKVGAKKLFSGKIISIKKIAQEGFSSKIVEMTNRKQKSQLFIKNENIIFWINNQVILTCPDLIIMVNKDYYPVFNEDIKIGMKITVFGVKSVKLWRTPMGRELFSPKTFGFSFKPKLL